MKRMLATARMASSCHQCLPLTVDSSESLTAQAHSLPLMPPIQNRLFELVVDRFHVGIGGGGGERADGVVLRVIMICDFPRR